jgi:hypothetical protein
LNHRKPFTRLRFVAVFRFEIRRNDDRGPKAGASLRQKIRLALWQFFRASRSKPRFRSLRGIVQAKYWDAGRLTLNQLFFILA